MKKICFILLISVIIINNNVICYGSEIYLYEINDKEVITKVEIDCKSIEETFIYLIHYRDKKLKNSIPENTILNSCQVVNGNLVLDFNDSFLNYGGSHYENCILNQIMYTAFSFENINSLSILINGENIALREGSIISEYSRNEFLNNILKNIILKLERKLEEIWI